MDIDFTESPKIGVMDIPQNRPNFRLIRESFYVTEDKRLVVQMLVCLVVLFLVIVIRG